MINQIEFECTYKILTVSARRWRPVVLRRGLHAERILLNRILFFDVIVHGRPILAFSSRPSRLAIWTYAMDVFAAKTINTKYSEPQIILSIDRD